MIRKFLGITSPCEDLEKLAKKTAQQQIPMLRKYCEDVLREVKCITKK